MVVTSSQTQRETPRDRSSEPQEEPEETESFGQSDVWQTEYNFDDDMFVGNQSSKEKKSRSQKRKDRYKHATQKIMAGDLTFNVSREEFCKLQDVDPAILSLKKRKPQLLAEQNESWYYLWTPKHGDEPIEQLILPKHCHQIVCKLAHSIPLAGHLGRDKTIKSIIRHFYWPSVFCDVAEYCRRCSECQRTAKGSQRKVPLIPLPLMEEPFEKIATDIVGLLSRSRRVSQYILVVCDYATRYPEAMACRKVDAGSVADHFNVVVCKSGYSQGDPL